MLGMSDLLAEVDHLNSPIFNQSTIYDDEGTLTDHASSGSSATSEFSRKGPGSGEDSHSFVRTVDGRRKLNDFLVSSWSPKVRVLPLLRP